MIKKLKIKDCKSPEEWCQLAGRVANYVSAKMMPAHRGAIETETISDVVAVFGNDGYSTDNRSKLEVERVRAKLAGLGVHELGFAVDAGEGYTWVMLVECDTTCVEALDDLVWYAWMSQGTAENGFKEVFQRVQQQIASDVIADRSPLCVE